MNAARLQERLTRLSGMAVNAASGAALFTVSQLKPGPLIEAHDRTVDNAVNATSPAAKWLPVEQLGL
jgi:hypothetical protein